MPENWEVMFVFGKNSGVLVGFGNIQRCSFCTCWAGSNLRGGESIQVEGLMTPSSSAAQCHLTCGHYMAKRHVVTNGVIHSQKTCDHKCSHTTCGLKCSQMTCGLMRNQTTCGLIHCQMTSGHIHSWWRSGLRQPPRDNKRQPRQQ